MKDLPFPEERLTSLARNALGYAEKEAFRTRSDYVRTDHLLIGLLESNEERKGIGQFILNKFGFDCNKAREIYESLIPKQESDRASEDMLYASALKQALRYAEGEAVDESIGRAMLWLGIMKEKTGLGNTVMEKLGIDELSLKQTVVEELMKGFVD